jgi:hypothetical protein
MTPVPWGFDARTSVLDAGTNLFDRGTVVLDARTMVFGGGNSFLAPRATLFDRAVALDPRSAATAGDGEARLG